MREIKFRVYSHETEKYYLTTEGDISAYNLYYYNDAEEISDTTRNGKKSTIEQFTGMKDKNGVEIYEGDIVRFLFTDWASKSPNDDRTLGQYLIDIATVYEVTFGDVCFCLTRKDEYGYGNTNSMYHGSHGYIEVIGNIHEDMDLLTT